MGEKLGLAAVHFPLILCRLLEGEVHPAIPGACTLCQEGNTQYRCLECMQSPALCKKYLHSTHLSTPFHWVEEWMGSYFKRQDLSETDFVLSLGHEGCICPHVLSKTKTSSFSVTHVNGIHKVKLQYCFCPGSKDMGEQLLNARLFPATWKKPQSTFTWQVLEDWHLDTLTSKKSSYDYVKKLRRLTNNASVHQVMVSLYFLPSLVCPSPQLPSGSLPRVHVRLPYMAILEDVQASWSLSWHHIPQPGQ